MGVRKQGYWWKMRIRAGGSGYGGWTGEVGSSGQGHGRTGARGLSNGVYVRERGLG